MFCLLMQLPYIFRANPGLMEKIWELLQGLQGLQRLHELVITGIEQGPGTRPGAWDYSRQTNDYPSFFLSCN